MKITIIYDNESIREGLIPDWGFACLVEAYGKRILFDTGANGAILLNNFKTLEIDPSSFDTVIISHNHYDHIGGLSDFLVRNKAVTLYLPGTPKQKYHAAEVINVDQAVNIDKQILSTGLLKNIEQFLIIESEKALVIIADCSHPRVDAILEICEQYGDIYALIGGLHGFSEFELIDKLQMICPTHCTQHIKEIKSRYPDKYIRGGAGQVIEI